MMIKKAQGLMSEEEARALLDKYQIYVISEHDYPNKEEAIFKPQYAPRLGIGDKGRNNILFYTIDPVDYNILMGRETKRNEKLFVTFSGANDFTIDKFFMQSVIYHPIKELKQMGFSTTSNSRGISKNITEKNIDAYDSNKVQADYTNTVLAVAQYIREKILDESRGYDEIKRFSFMFKETFFSIEYDNQSLIDEYNKAINTQFPSSFTEGFETYFTPKASKNIMKKIRSIINRRGSRELFRGVSTDSTSFEYSDLTEQNKETNLLRLNRFLDPIIDAVESIDTMNVRALDEKNLFTMRDNFLKAMALYFETKSYTRPLTLARLKSQVISREVSTMLNTAVSSALPGFYTSEGRQVGYQFNKSIPEKIRQFELALTNPKEFLEQSDDVVYKVPSNTPLSPAVARQIESIDDIIDNQKTRDNLERNVAMGLIFTSDAFNNYTNQWENKTPRELVSEHLVVGTTEPYGFNRILEEPIRDLFKRYGYDDGRLNVEYEKISGNKFIISVLYNYDVAVSEEYRVIRVDFLFTHERENIMSLNLIRNLKLEKAIAGVSRYREQTKTFEIDINSPTDFYLEMSKVFKRILVAEDFQSGSPGYSERNPTELSNAMVRGAINSYLRILGGKAIEVRPFAYDSLTGSRRGLYYIVVEGNATIYISVDDRKAGVAATRDEYGYADTKGSACLGNLMLEMVPENAPLEGWESAVYLSPENKVKVNHEPSMCVNLTIPETERTRGPATGGYNVDSLSNVLGGVGLQGGKIGTPLLPPNVKQTILGGFTDERGREVASTHLPSLDVKQSFSTLVGDDETGEFINAAFNFPENIMDVGGYDVKVNNLAKVASGLLNKNNIKSSEEARDFIQSNIEIELPDSVTTIVEADVLPSVKDKAFQYAIEGLVKFYNETGQQRITSFDLLQQLVDTNREELYEIHLEQARLGADYGGGGFDYKPQQEIENRSLNIRRIKRREGGNNNE